MKGENVYDNVYEARLAEFVGQRCRVRVTWTLTGAHGSAGDDAGLIDATMLAVVPLGRDCFLKLLDRDTGETVLVKAGAVVEVRT